MNNPQGSSTDGKYFIEHEMNGLFEFIDSLKRMYFLKRMCLIITNMAHFLKNRRTQITISFVKMNGQKIPVACLNDYLMNSAAIADKSSLSKLQDTFPILIFNHQISLQIIKSGNFDLSFFLFPITIVSLGKKQDCIYCNVQYMVLRILTIVSLGKKQIKDTTEIIPQQAIKRAFAACTIIWKELKECDGFFNFAQWGTMVQEHFHVLIRGMTHGADALNNTIMSIARSNIIMDIMNKQHNQKKRKTRYSVGGTHFDSSIHINEYIFPYAPQAIVERLEKMSTYGNREEFHDDFIYDFYSWIEIINKGSLPISCTNKHFHYGR